MATKKRNNEEQGTTVKDNQDPIYVPQYVLEHIEQPELSVEEGYRRVREIIKPQGKTRSEARRSGDIDKVFVSPDGWMAVARETILIVLAVDAAGIEVCTGLPYVDFHKTDDIKISEEGIEVQCEHKTDKSGEFEAVSPDYPAIQFLFGEEPPQASPDSSRISAFSINTDLLGETGQVISEKNIDLHLWGDRETPVFIRGDYGAALVAPSRWP